MKKMGLSPQMPQRSSYIKAADVEILYILMLNLKVLMCITNGLHMIISFNIKYRIKDVHLSL